MRIGIDVRYLSHGLMGGVHTYVTHFVPALVKLAGQHQIFLYADQKNTFELSELPANVCLRILPWRNGLSSVYNDFFMSRSIQRDRLDIVHFPANYGFGPAGTPVVITLHDEINILPWFDIVKGHPKQLRTIAMMSYLHFCSSISVRQARLIITVSEYSRRQIAHYSGLELNKVIAVPHAPTPDLIRIEDPLVLADVCQRHGISKSFVLADALKNPAVLVRAWKRMPTDLTEGWEIVFFSRRPDPLPVVHEAVSLGIARLLIRPSRSDLIALYSQAGAFVFPSWIEGFGLPILEAMTCGAPVVASDRGAIPEVAGEAALLMDAEDDATLARHIERVLSDPGESNRLRELGLARAARYSWSATAQQILNIYDQAVNG
jgi:glycosyltransferase involved in cell wall biosynthesis